MRDAPADAGPPVLETQLVAPAPVPGIPPPAAIAVGAVLSRTFRAWWAHFGAFAAMSLVVYAPLLAAFGVFFGWALEAAEGRPPERVELGWRLGGLFAGATLTTALSVVQTGAVTYATVRHLHGERASFGRMVGVGLRRGLPVVGTGLVVWIVFLAGFVVMFAPGLLFLVAACVAVPAAVVERPGVLGAIRRSFELTRGSRWPLFAAGLVVMAVVWALSAAVQVAVMVVVAFLPPAKALAATLVACQAGSALFSVVPIVAIAVCYHDLRVAREGVDTAALARVFE